MDSNAWKLDHGRNKNIALSACMLIFFAQSMRNRWDNLVYIDLYSGPGFARIRGSNKILRGSPLIAMSLPIPFTHYVFCDSDQESIDALRNRTTLLYPGHEVHFVCGNCNDKIDEIESHIPAYSKNNRVLSFCFVDPFSLSLKFSTIRQLGSRALDFLILLALHMDGNRNYKTYENKEDATIDEFLDNPSWRKDFIEAKIADNERFVQFLARCYNANMVAMSYLKPKELHPIRSDDKNLPLYHLAFYSKHTRGQTFWNDIRKYAVPQLGLDL